MNYEIKDMRKIKKCPKCRRYKTGEVCVCGYKWQKENPKGKTTRINPKNIPTCRCCNLPGDYGGLCKMHHEQEAEMAYRKKMESYRIPGKNDYEIDVLTKKIMPQKPKQEGANDSTKGKS
jgi:hypothetical protein